MILFTYDDGGRAASRRPRQHNDCVVRACAVALHVPYDQAYDTLANAGRDCGHGMMAQDYSKTLTQCCTQLHEWTKCSLSEFIAAHPQGSYIIRIWHHATALVDGVVHDDHMFFDQPVLAAWQVHTFPKVQALKRAYDDIEV